MVLHKLNETLDELHRQLEAAASIDAGERDRLGRAMDEIRQALAKAEATDPSPRQDRDTGPVERLEDFVERFEEEHPTLCARLADLAQSLHNVGF